MKNEILEEVWRNRDEFARKCNYDIDAMVKALQENERQSNKILVDRRTPNSRMGSIRQKNAIKSSQKRH
jgi:hypothetical protein